MPEPGVYVIHGEPVYSAVDPTGGATLLYPAGTPIPWDVAALAGLIPPVESLYPTGSASGADTGAPAPESAPQAPPGQQTRPAKRGVPPQKAAPKVTRKRAT